MQVKRVPCPPAIKLIGRVSAEAFAVVLRELDAHGAGRWEVSKVGRNRTDGPYFVIRYWPTDPPRVGYFGGRLVRGPWSMCFGFDGSLWMD